MSGLSGRAEAEVGLIAPSAKGVMPGWLECDGSEVSRTAYAALFAVIGTQEGAGDGSTTFNLPDIRGDFIRGFDNGRGVDVGRVEGSSQLDEVKSHNHNVPVSSSRWGSGNGGGFGWGNDGQSKSVTAPDVTSTGGVETRPRNTARRWLIKY
jgi:phage-related tail fiber protein